MSMSPELSLTDHLDDEVIIGYAVDAAFAEAGVTFGEEFFTETEAETGDVRKDLLPVATDVNGGWHGNDFAPQETVEE
jgi:hypothetical protein